MRVDYTLIPRYIQTCDMNCGVPLNRALPVFPSTAPPSVCVPDIIGALVVWRQNKTKFKILSAASETRYVVCASKIEHSPRPLFRLRLLQRRFSAVMRLQADFQVLPVFVVVQCEVLSAALGRLRHAARPERLDLHLSRGL